jgi:hypothetical protein
MKEIKLNSNNKIESRFFSLESENSNACSDFSNSIKTYGDGITHEAVNGLSVQFFEVAGRLCFHDLDLDGIARSYGVNFFSNGTTIYGKVTTTGKVVNSDIVYVSPTNEVYIGKLESEEAFDNKLSLFETETDEPSYDNNLNEYPDVTENQETPTPTPTLTPEYQSEEEEPEFSDDAYISKITLDNIDFDESGIYNQRSKLAGISEDKMEIAIDAEKNEYLKKNPYTGEYNFVYSSDVDIAKFPNFYIPGGSGGFDYQFVVAFKKPISIQKNSLLHMNFVPVGVSYGTAGGSRNLETNKVSLYASEQLNLNDITPRALSWPGCVCCPFYSFQAEHNVGVVSASENLTNIKYLVFGGLLAGCNGKPNYRVVLQSFSISSLVAKTPTPTELVDDGCAVKEYFKNIGLHIKSSSKKTFNLVTDESQYDIGINQMEGLRYETTLDGYSGNDVSLKFDGESDYLYTEDTHNFDGIHLKNDDFTIEAWIKLVAPPTPTPTKSMSVSKSPSYSKTLSKTKTPSKSKTPTPTKTPSPTPEYSWFGSGSSEFGTLGFQTSGHNQVNVEVPVDVNQFFDGEIAQYEISYGSTYVVTDKRSVYYFGRIYYGLKNQPTYYMPPKKLSFPTGIKVKRVFGSRSSVGGNRTFYYIDAYSNLYEGSPHNGGRPYSGTHKIIDTDVRYVSFWGESSLNTVAYVKNDGTLWGLGRGSEGQLGRGSTSNQSNPVQIAGPTESDTSAFDSSGNSSPKIIKVEMGNQVCVYLDETNKLYATGKFSNVLDYNTASTRKVSTPVKINENILDFDISDHILGVVDTTGSVWTRGSANPSYFLGHTQSRNTFIKIHDTELLENERVSSIKVAAFGGNFLTVSGKLYGFGNNKYGVFGKVSGHAPVLVEENVESLSLGQIHMIYRKQKNSLVEEPTPTPSKSKSQSKTITPCPTVTCEVFQDTGDDQIFIVPTGTTEIQTQIWGAGGSDGCYVTGGGSGGYTQGTISVTPGEKLIIGVGQTALETNPYSHIAAYSPGGSAGNGGQGGHKCAGAGGGMSGIFRETISSESALLIAGGGGGAAGSGTAPLSGGGGGGGLSGGTGHRYPNDNAGGPGGTQTVGYAKFTGGAGTTNGQSSGGGGGAGWYGGRGGEGLGGQDSCGGGGSGYISSEVTDGETVTGQPGQHQGTSISHKPTELLCDEFAELVADAGNSNQHGLVILKIKIGPKNPTPSPTHTPTPTPTPTFDSISHTSCGNPCTSLVSSTGNFSNLGDTWTNFHPLVASSVYNDNQSEQINDWSIVLTEISNGSVPAFMQNESHVLQIETRSTGRYNAGFFMLDQDAQSETINPKSCANISFKYSFVSSTSGGHDGMAYGLVAKQGDNYFANYYGITKETSTVIDKIDKELVDGSWLRIAGSGETSQPEWNAPTSFGVFFANSNSNITKAIATDFKICLYHPEITPTPTPTPTKTFTPSWSITPTLTQKINNFSDAGCSDDLILIKEFGENKNFLGLSGIYKNSEFTDFSSLGGYYNRFCDFRGNFRRKTWGCGGLMGNASSTGWTPSICFWGYSDHVVDNGNLDGDDFQFFDENNQPTVCIGDAKFANYYTQPNLRIPINVQKMTYVDSLCVSIKDFPEYSGLYIFDNTGQTPRYDLFDNNNNQLAYFSTDGNTWQWQTKSIGNDHLSVVGASNNDSGEVFSAKYVWDAFCSEKLNKQNLTSNSNLQEGDPTPTIFEIKYRPDDCECALDELDYEDFVIVDTQD